MTIKQLSRRQVLKGFGALGLTTGLGAGILKPVLAQEQQLRTIKLAWSLTAECQAPISVAVQRGFFKERGLDVQLVNFGSSTDTLLQAIATGKADGGIGMALRWLKPLEQGFDVDLTVGTHGGCMRLMVPQNSPIKNLKDLVGKSVAVTDQASPIRNFFAIKLAEQGIDPDKQVSWVQYPADLFGEALKKGEVQAIATDDPQGWLIKHRDNLVEIDNNMNGNWAHVTCCVLGLRGSLVRDEPDLARKITQAIVDAQQWTADNPEATAEVYKPYIPKGVSATEITAMLKEQSHNHHSTGLALRKEIVQYVNALKTIHVIRPETDAQKFADHYVPVLFKGDTAQNDQQDAHSHTMKM